MDYDKIILELLSRVVTLEEKVAKLEAGKADAIAQESDVSSGSKKYRFLSDYLFESNLSSVKLTFEEIETILKFSLPESAYTHRAFWANTSSHSIALSWLHVNYQVVEANIEDRYIVFEKKREFEKMTINEQMKVVTQEIVAEYGFRHIISLKEFYELLGARFGTNRGSVIPADYCYNRTNKGIEFLRKPRLLVHLGDGLYECVGENYLYNGPVFTNAKGSGIDIEVGRWENGIFYKNDNWDLYDLR